MTVADRIAVMDRGRLMQVAPPAEIYERPNSRWVADFIGEVNLFEGRVGDDGVSVEGTALGRLRVAAKIDAEPRADGLGRGAAGEDADHAGRACGGSTSGSENRVAATVVDVGYLGDVSIYKLRLRRRRADQGGDRQYRPLRRGRDRLGRQSVAELSAASRNRADAMKPSSREMLVLAKARRPHSLCVARRVLPRAVPDRAQDQPVADRDRAAALYADIRSRRRLARRAKFLRRSFARQLRLSRHRSALHFVLCEEPADRGILDAASARHRLSDRLRHHAHAAAGAGDTGRARHPAVLDVVSHPHLCLDEYSAARRAAQSVAHGAAHRE